MGSTLSRNPGWGASGSEVEAVCGEACRTRSVRSRILSDSGGGRGTITITRATLRFLAGGGAESCSRDSGDGEAGAAAAERGARAAWAFARDRVTGGALRFGGAVGSGDTRGGSGVAGASESEAGGSSRGPGLF